MVTVALGPKEYEAMKAGDPCPFCEGTHATTSFKRNSVGQLEPHSVRECSYCDSNGKLKPNLEVHLNMGALGHAWLRT